MMDATFSHKSSSSKLPDGVIHFMLFLEDLTDHFNC